MADGSAVYPIEQFGGLDLNSPQDRAACVDCLNVDIYRDQVRTRPGYALGTAAANSIVFLREIPNSTSAYHLLAGTSGGIHVYDDVTNLKTVTRIDTTTGTVQTSVGTTTAAVRFGDATNEYVYVATGSDQIRRFKPS